MAAVLPDIKAETGDDSMGAGLGLGCIASTRRLPIAKGSVSIRDACFLGPCIA